MVTFAPGTPNEYQFVFVDGGVTTYNNPAFLAFQMATAAPYKLNWQTGRDKLLLVSVGTGCAAFARPSLQADDLWLGDHVKNVPRALMNGACTGWDMACRILGDCRFGSQLDRELGDMVLAVDAPVSNWTGSKQFTYVRYDPDVNQAGLNALGLEGIQPENVQVMDSVEHIRDIQRIGLAYAQKYVSLQHLHPF